MRCASCRFYGADQVDAARLIAALRQIGAPLAEIKTILDVEPGMAADRVADYSGWRPSTRPDGTCLTSSSNDYTGRGQAARRALCSGSSSRNLSTHGARSEASAGPAGPCPGSMP